MKLNQRQKDILRILKEKKRVSVSDMASQLFVSEMTIRRDFKEMEQNSLLTRYHGGAIYYEKSIEYPIELRRLIGAKEKKILSCRAKKYLKDGQIIYIDSSSTSSYIIPYLKEYKGIKVITNSVPALMMLAKIHVPCVLTGGDYCETDMCLVGRAAEEFVRDINPDIAFFSSLGLSDDGYITDVDERQLSIRKILLKNCGKIIFMFDSSKLHKKYTYTLCHRDAADEIIIL